MVGMRRGVRVALLAGALATTAVLAGCQTGRGGEAAPAGPATHACAAGTPPLEVLDLETFGGGEPSEDDVAWQMDAAALAEQVTALAGDRLAAVWLAWEPERSLQVRLTEGPEISALHAAADASGLVVAIAYERTVSEAQLLAAADALGGAWVDVPGVGGMGVDSLGGRLLFDVAAGDDGGAATCAALTEILADAGVPYGFDVFEGPTESSVRGPARFTEARLSDPRTLSVNVSTCGGDPEITTLEETETEVRLQVTSTSAAPGWPSAACLDGLDITLAAPLGDRVLIDLTTGAAVPVGGTQAGEGAGDGE